MKSRRGFLKTVAAVGALGVVDRRARKRRGHRRPRGGKPVALTIGCTGFPSWKKLRGRFWFICRKASCDKKMPSETAVMWTSFANTRILRPRCATLVGLAPWLELPDSTGRKPQLQQEFLDLAVRGGGLDSATDPQSPDFMHFKGEQPLVDAAFLAQAILRAPTVLWKSLDGRLKQHIVDALEATRTEKPINNNHILFAALVETRFWKWASRLSNRELENYLRRMLEWYVGDGVYGDGQFPGSIITTAS